MPLKFLICENIFYSFLVNIIIGASTTSFIFASGTPFFGKTNYTPIPLFIAPVRVRIGLTNIA